MFVVLITVSVCRYKRKLLYHDLCKKNLGVCFANLFCLMSQKLRLVLFMCVIIKKSGGTFSFLEKVLHLKSGWGYAPDPFREGPTPSLHPPLLNPPPPPPNINSYVRPCTFYDSPCIMSFQPIVQFGIILIDLFMIMSLHPHLCAWWDPVSIYSWIHDTLKFYTDASGTLSSGAYFNRSWLSLRIRADSIE